ncbi:hypothetical protein MAHJHV60_46950 [Mycobacterium avium subsp. hominissuis]
MEDWAEIRRLYRSEKLSQAAIAQLSAARDKGPARRRFCHEHGTTRLPVMGPPG